MYLFKEVTEKRDEMVFRHYYQSMDGLLYFEKDPF